MRKQRTCRTAAAAFVLACCLIFSACIFGGGSSGQAASSGEAGNTESLPQKTAAAESTAAAGNSEGTQQNSTTEDNTQAETAPQPDNGPVTAEDVAADLEEAAAALTGAEGAHNAHLLDAAGNPIEDFVYEGGAAVAAPYVRIGTGAVTGQGDTAQAVLTVTSPDLMPLIEKAVEGMEEFDEAAMNENLAALLAAGGYAETAYEVTVELKKIGGTWYIEQNRELQNALAGGLFAAEAEAAPTAGGNP